MLLQIVQLVKYSMKCQLPKSRDFTSFLVTSGNKGCLPFPRAIYRGKLVSSHFGQMVSKIQDIVYPNFRKKFFPKGFFPFNFAPGIFLNFRLNGSLFGNSPVSGIFGNFSWQFLYHYCLWFQIVESFG